MRRKSALLYSVWIASLLAVAMAGRAAASCLAAPEAGGRITGIVRAAPNGSVVCVQTGASHDRLTRVRLADAPAPALAATGGEGAKWTLRRVARGRAVTCAMDRRQAGVGVCRIGGQSIAARLARR